MDVGFSAAATSPYRSASIDLHYLLQKHSQSENQGRISQDNGEINFKSITLIRTKC